MSLYGDIAVVPGDKKPISASLTSIKLLQDHLRLKSRENKHRDAGSRRRGGGQSLPSHRPGTSFALESALVAPVHISDDLTSTTGSLLGGDWDTSQEYDPARPNDYEKIVRDKKESQERDRMQRNRKAIESMPIQVTAKKRLVGYNSDDDDDDDDDNVTMPAGFGNTSAAKTAGAAIPPPKELTMTSNEPSSCLVTGMSTTAAKIMMKMGYRDGSGLGKEEQGMAKPLQVTKIGVREGKICAADADTGDRRNKPSVPLLSLQQQQPSDASSSSSSSSQATAADTSRKIEDEPDKKITDMMKSPTKVVLLTNMVGPGEVDDDLEPETKEECGKYGEVVKCVIFELPGPGIRAEDAVRIFVEFKRIESAIKAVVDLNGRFFGGRTVRASFFDQDRFRSFDLMDK